MIKVKQSGFSLVELMVAMTISVVFVGVAATLLVRNKTDYVPVRDFSRMNEGAMAVLDVVTKEIQQAGFFGENDAYFSRVNGGGVFVNHIYPGVTPGQGLFALNSRTDPATGFSASVAIEGYDGDAPNEQFYPSGTTRFEDGDNLADEIFQGNGTTINVASDAITIRGSYGGVENIELIDDATGLAIGNRGRATPVTADIPVNASNIPVQSTAGFPDVGYFIIYDSTSSELFQGKLNGNSIDLVAVAPGNSDKITKAFLSDLDGSPITGVGNTAAFVTVARFSRYYIGLYETPSGEKVPSLFREFYSPRADNGNGDIVRDTQVLIEGVESMQITYGEDTTGVDGAIDVYVRAHEVTNWANVKAVKIALLVRSQTQSGSSFTGSGDDANDTYTVNDEDIVIPRAADQYLRRVYNAHIALDNRL